MAWTVDPEEARRTADDVLSRSEFDEPEPTLFRRGVEWVLERLDRLFGREGDEPVLGGGDAGAGGSSWFTILVLVVALVGTVLVARVLLRSGVLSRRQKRRSDELAVDVSERRSAQAWDELARRLEAEGRWKDALRARFGALVEQLIERGVVEDVPGRTTGEYRVQVRRALPDAGDDFAAAADLFDRAWYGDAPTGPDEAQRFVHDAERVLTSAGPRR